MPRFTIVREERTQSDGPWTIVSSQTMDTGATRYRVVTDMDNVHAGWLGISPHRRIVVHEWDV